MWPKSDFERKVFIKMVIKLSFGRKKKKGLKQDVCQVYYPRGKKFARNKRFIEPRKVFRGDTCSSHRGHSPSTPRRTDSGLANIRSPQRVKKDRNENMVKESIQVPKVKEGQIVTKQFLTPAKKKQTSLSPNETNEVITRRSPSARTRKLYKHSRKPSDGLNISLM